MRTTLDIDKDVLEAAKERARVEQKTMGQVVSELMRRALTSATGPAAVRETSPVYGFRPFPAGDRVVTNTLINEIRDDDAY